MVEHNISGKTQGTTDHHGASPEVLRDIVLGCMVLHNILRRHQSRVARPPSPVDDIQPLQVDHMVHGPYENPIRNPSREAIHQQDLLKDLGVLTGQEERI